jgi:hypothetical protein
MRDENDMHDEDGLLNLLSGNESAPPAISHNPQAELF